jgi:hypothetical protein
MRNGREFPGDQWGLWALSPEEQWAFVKGQGFNFKPEAILWLCEARAPGVPSTQKGCVGWRIIDGLCRRLSPIFGSFKCWCKTKFGGKGESCPERGRPALSRSGKLAREQKVALAYWIPPRGGGIAVFNENLLERLSRAVRKKGSVQNDFEPSQARKGKFVRERSKMHS